MTPTDLPVVWVFKGGGHNSFPSAVFQTREEAEAWILPNHLSGTLTAYPVGVPVHTWAIELGLFKPTSPKHTSPAFVANFSSAAQEHYHYDGDATLD